MNRKYTKTHEWIEKQENGMYRVGISDYAQKSLGDVVYIGVPTIGAPLKAEQNCAVIESVKSASDIYTPVDGTISAVNEALADTPELVNQSPYGDGWIFELEVSNPDPIHSLLNESEYESTLE